MARLTSSHVRILVVEDHDPYRRHVCSLVGTHSHFRVVGESGDGAKAVLQAAAVQPDVILLDIGLPGINGLEAARRIAKVAGQARIIFLTQETCAEVIEEAFVLGAWGYVLKANTGSDLVAAIEAVSRGQRFLSHGLEVYTAGPQKA
jgi:DNA-binding NarL/FixJ family response regulator